MEKYLNKLPVWFLKQYKINQINKDEIYSNPVIPNNPDEIIQQVNEMATRAFEEAHTTFHNVMDNLIGNYPNPRELASTASIRDVPANNL